MAWRKKLFGKKKLKSTDAIANSIASVERARDSPRLGKKKSLPRSLAGEVSFTSPLGNTSDSDGDFPGGVTFFSRPHSDDVDESTQLSEEEDESDDDEYPNVDTTRINSNHSTEFGSETNEESSNDDDDFDSETEESSDENNDEDDSDAEDDAESVRNAADVVLRPRRDSTENSTFGFGASANVSPARRSTSEDFGWHASVPAHRQSTASTTSGFSLSAGSDDFGEELESNSDRFGFVAEHSGYASVARVTSTSMLDEITEGFEGLEKVGQFANPPNPLQSDPAIGEVPTAKGKSNISRNRKPSFYSGFEDDNDSINVGLTQHSIDSGDAKPRVWGNTVKEDSVLDAMPSLSTSNQEDTTILLLPDGKPVLKLFWGYGESSTDPVGSPGGPMSNPAMPVQELGAWESSDDERSTSPNASSSHQGRAIIRSSTVWKKPANALKQSVVKSALRQPNSARSEAMVRFEIDGVVEMPGSELELPNRERPRTPPPELSEYEDVSVRRLQSHMDAGRLTIRQFARIAMMLNEGGDDPVVQMVKKQMSSKKTTAEEQIAILEVLIKVSAGLDDFAS